MSDAKLAEISERLSRAVEGLRLCISPSLAESWRQAQTGAPSPTPHMEELTDIADQLAKSVKGIAREHQPPSS